MGNIDLLYHRSQELPTPLMPGDIWIDIGENIHLHIRDLRLEFTRKEFLEFLFHVEKMNTLFQEWNHKTPEWKESDDPASFNNRYVIWLGDYKPGKHKLEQQEAFYWPRRISIERNANDTFHVHYRNLRIEMAREAFQQIKMAFEGVDPCESEEVEKHRTDFLRRESVKDQKHPEFRGFLDAVQGDRVRGWVQAIADPKVKWEVSFVADGKELGRVLATQYRGDLEHAFGYGFSSFDVEIPALLCADAKNIQAFIQPWQIELKKGEGFQASGQRTPFLQISDPAALPIDPLFFERFIKGRPLTSVECKEVELTSLKVHMYTPKGEKYVPIKECPAYRYLCGDKDFYHEYHRYENAYNHHDEIGFLKLIESMKKTGYEIDKLITVFNGDGIIRDGHHRAAILLHQQKTKKIPILNICFAT